MTTLGIPSAPSSTPTLSKLSKLSTPRAGGARRAGRAGRRTGLAGKLWRRVVFSAFVTGLVGVAAVANQLALYATGSP
jgi:hypothetical protein